MPALHCDDGHRPARSDTRRDAAPEIAYPADGTEIDLGLALGDTAPLVVKIRNGVPPFTVFADGAPVGRAAFSRQRPARSDKT